MEQRLNLIIRIIDAFGYVSAFYELIIKHHIGLGIILTIISCLLSITVYIMSNVEKYKEKYNDLFTDKDGQSSLSRAEKFKYYKIIIGIYILSYILFITLLSFSTQTHAPLAAIFMIIIFYSMPIFFALITREYCYIVDEIYIGKFQKLAFLVSLIISLIIYSSILIADSSLFDLIITFIFQFYPLYYSYKKI